MVVQRTTMIYIMLSNTRMAVLATGNVWIRTGIFKLGLTYY